MYQREKVCNCSIHVNREGSGVQGVYSDNSLILTYQLQQIPLPNNDIACSEMVRKAEIPHFILQICDRISYIVNNSVFAKYYFKYAQELS
jgi:hypothetical protein